MELRRRESIVKILTLTQTLVDPAVVQRYGTSEDMNMEREYSKIIDQRYQQLIAEFKKMDKGPKDSLDTSEIQRLLSSYISEVIIPNLEREEAYVELLQ